MNNAVILQLVNVVLGALSPVLIAVLKAIIAKQSTPTWVVFLISFVYSMGLGIVSTLVAGYAFSDWTTMVTSMGVVFTSTQVSYNTIMNQIGWTDKIVNFVRGTEPTE
jgi:polyferredoxin